MPGRLTRQVVRQEEPLHRADCSDRSFHR
jgi:hypothetical protein